MFTTRLLTASALALTGVLITPVAASAAAPWDAPILSNNYSWEIDSGLDSYDSTDDGDVYTSMYYETGLLKFGDGLGGYESSGDWCTDPIAPGTVTTVGADTVITCAPAVVGVGQPGEGLTVTVQIRILHSLDVARFFYTVSNQTASAITVPEVFTYIEWEEDGYYGVTSSGVTGDGVNYFDLDPQDTWVIATEGPSYMPSAVVWGAACDTNFVVTGDSDISYVETQGATTFAANSSRYYVNFLQMQTPAAETEAAMNAAIDDLADSLAARYKSLTPALSVGMPAGIDVEGWQANCSSAESEGLAPTGPNDSILAGSVVLAALLASLSVIVRKTRRQRS
jgi:hypothetical protein